MALITCPECAGSISDKATACPHCGFPVNPQPSNNPVVQHLQNLRQARLQNPQPNFVELENVDFGTQFPYPGPMPSIQFFFALKTKFHLMGTIAGRKYAEIVKVVGPPKSRNTHGQGQFTCLWISPMTISGKRYSIQLLFDSNYICGGVLSQTEG